MPIVRVAFRESWGGEDRCFLHIPKYSKMWRQKEKKQKKHQHHKGWREFHKIVKQFIKRAWEKSSMKRLLILDLLDSTFPHRNCKSSWHNAHKLHCYPKISQLLSDIHFLQNNLSSLLSSNTPPVQQRAFWHISRCAHRLSLILSSNSWKYISGFTHQGHFISVLRFNNTPKRLYGIQCFYQIHTNSTQNMDSESFTQGQAELVITIEIWYERHRLLLVGKIAFIHPTKTEEIKCSNQTSAHPIHFSNFLVFKSVIEGNEISQASHLVRFRRASGGRWRGKRGMDRWNAWSGMIWCISCWIVSPLCLSADSCTRTQRVSQRRKRRGDAIWGTQTTRMWSGQWRVRDSSQSRYLQKRMMACEHSSRWSSNFGRMEMWVALNTLRCE